MGMQRSTARCVKLNDGCARNHCAATAPGNKIGQGTVKENNLGRIGKDEVSSSNLDSSSTETRCPARDSGFFLWFFPLCFPLLAQNVLDVTLHAAGALLFHLVSDVPVHVQGKGGGGVAEIALHRLDIVPGTDGGHGVGVPLCHNRDKSESPCAATGFGFVFILFPLKRSLKRRTAKGGDNCLCHVSDKFFELGGGQKWEPGASL